MRSKQYCSAASIPSPSRSNLTSPIQAASSLSHWMTVRFSMRACSIGTTSPDRPVGQHHAAGVDAEVPRRLQQLDREVDDGLRDVVVVPGRQGRAPALHLLRPGVLLAGAVAERLRHVAHRVLRPVLDDVGDLRGVAAAVLLEHPLDDLLAAVRVEVDVDVGLLVAQARQEPLERQLVEDRVDRGDAEQVADRRVGGRAAALAEDALALREVHDVVHDQEVAGEVLLLDHGELVLDALPVVVGEVRVLRRHGIPDQLPQVRHRGVPLGHVLLRQGGLGAAQREGELVGELDGALDGARIPREAVAHLAPRAQMGGSGCGQPAVELVEAALGAHRGDRGREVALGGGGVVHVAGRDDREAALGGEGGERVVVVGVERVAVVDELDVDVVAAEEPDEAGRARAGGSRRAPSVRSATSEAAPAAPHPSGIRSASPSARRRARASSSRS